MTLSDVERLVRPHLMKYEQILREVRSTNGSALPVKPWPTGICPQCRPGTARTPRLRKDGGVLELGGVALGGIVSFILIVILFLAVMCLAILAGLYGRDALERVQALLALVLAQAGLSLDQVRRRIESYVRDRDLGTCEEYHEGFMEAARQLLTMINSTPTMRNPTTAWLEDARRLLRQIEENVANLVTCLDPTGSLGLRVLLVGAGIIRVAADCVRRELTIQVP